MIVTILIALAICLAICAYARPLGDRLDVVDHPDGKRKQHAGSTPLVGGIAVLVPLVLWGLARFATGEAADPVFLRTALLGAAGGGIIGFSDDQSDTSPLSRILALLFLSAMALTLDPRMVASALDFGTLGHVALGFSACVFLLIVTAIGLVNAVNMADGQNGLVIGLFCIWSLCILLMDDPATVEIAAVLVALLETIFFFNLRGKLFLGDTGSYGITFLFGLLVAFSHARGMLPLPVLTTWFFVPVVDCLRLLVSRPLRGKSPSTAGRDHFHHLLSARWGKAFGLTIYLGLVAVFSLIASLYPDLALYCLAGVAAAYAGLVIKAGHVASLKVAGIH